MPHLCKIPGVPGTTLDESLVRLIWTPVAIAEDLKAKIEQLPKALQNHNLRAWVTKRPDGYLRVFVGREPYVDQEDWSEENLRWHISVSHIGFDGKMVRCPTWDELKVAKYRLVPPDISMTLWFPSKEIPYLDDYETCLHLWESRER